MRGPRAEVWTGSVVGYGHPIARLETNCKDSRSFGAFGSLLRGAGASIDSRSCKRLSSCASVRTQRASDDGTKERSPVDTNEPEELLTPSEVAAMFRVNPKTVTRWARAGRISYIKTLGGHRRFKASEIRRLLSEADAGNGTQP